MSALQRLGAHPGDGALVRLLDGEPPEPGADAAVDARTATHAAGCAACAARVAELRASRATLRSLLAAADVAAPPPPSVALVRARGRARRPWHRRPALRAASALLVLGTGAVAAQPVREWARRQLARVGVGRAIEAAHGPASGTAPPAALPAAPPAAPLAAAARVAFVPGPGPVVVRFAARPSGGTLTVVASPDERLVTERFGDAAAPLLVLPDGVLVRNAPGVAADYRVTAPASRRVVRVRLGDAGAPELTVPLVVGETRVLTLRP